MEMDVFLGFERPLTKQTPEDFRLDSEVLNVLLHRPNGVARTHSNAQIKKYDQFGKY